MLTGGSRDVNPQFMRTDLTLSAANTYTEVEIQTPLNMLPVGSSSKAPVIEILKIWFELDILDNAFAATYDTNLIRCALCTKSRTSIATLGTPECIMRTQVLYAGAFTAAGTYGMVSEANQQYDLTDGAGHGILIAVPKLFFGASTTGQTNAGSFSVCISYRFKNVDVWEFVGMQQSQQ